MKGKMAKTKPNRPNVTMPTYPKTNPNYLFISHLSE